jgi:hypothetical protein
MNDYKCSCVSLVVVVHSLSTFLNKSLIQISWNITSGVYSH